MSARLAISPWGAPTHSGAFWRIDMEKLPDESARQKFFDTVTFLTSEKAAYSLYTVGYQASLSKVTALFAENLSLWTKGSQKDLRTLFLPFIEPQGEEKERYKHGLLGLQLLRSKLFKKHPDKGVAKSEIRDKLFPLFVSIYREWITIDHRFFMREKSVVDESEDTPFMVQSKWKSLAFQLQQREGGITGPKYPIDCMDIAVRITHLISSYNENRNSCKLNYHALVKGQLQESLLFELFMQLRRYANFEVAGVLMEKVKEELQSLKKGEKTEVTALCIGERALELFEAHPKLKGSLNIAFLDMWITQKKGRTPLKLLHLLNFVGKKLKKLNPPIKGYDSFSGLYYSVSTSEPNGGSSLDILFNEKKLA